MKRISTAVGSYLSDVQGSTATEYALIASFVSAVIAATVFGLGVDVAGLFQSIASAWPS